MNFKKAKEIIQEEISSILNEGRSGYWPGSMNDATFDTIHSMKEDICKEYLDEKLDELYNSYSQPSDEFYLNLYDQTNEESIWWNKEQYSNIITTLLQEGFVIPRKHADQALENYKEVMNDPKWKEYVNWEKSQNAFGNTIPVIIDELEKVLKEDHNEKNVYAPNFLDNNQLSRKLAEFKNGEDLSFAYVKSDRMNKFFFSYLDEDQIKDIVNNIINEIDGKEYNKISYLDEIINEIDEYSKEDLEQLALILLGYKREMKIEKMN